VRPLVATSRTASSSNSFVTRRCFVIEFAFHLRKTLHFSEASPKHVEAKRRYATDNPEPVGWEGFYSRRGVAVT